jgi:hypothetical protein
VSAQPDFEDEDLLPDNLAPKAKVPMVRSKKQIEAARKAAERAEAERLAAESKTAAQENAKRLAQIVNLHIGGYSLAQIGAEIGATDPARTSHLRAQLHLRALPRAARSRA